MNEVAPAPAPALIGCRQQQIRDAAPPWRARPGPLLQRPSLPAPGGLGPRRQQQPCLGHGTGAGGWATPLGPLLVLPGKPLSRKVRGCCVVWGLIGICGRGEGKGGSEQAAWLRGHTALPGSSVT